LGERIVAEALTQSPGLLGAYFAAHAEDARAAFTVLNRISRLGPDGAPVHDATVMEPTQSQVQAALSGGALAALADAAAAAMNAEHGNLQVPVLAALNALNGAEQAQAALALTRAGYRHLNPNATPARLRALFGEAAKKAEPQAAAPAQTQDEAIALRRQRADDADARATQLSNAGDRPGALAAAQEAVALYRALAKENPQAFTPDLARTLSSYGDVLFASGRVDESVAAYSECATLLKPFFDAMPDAFGGLFLANLRDLVKALQAAGKGEADIIAALEALGVELGSGGDQPPEVQLFQAWAQAHDERRGEDAKAAYAALIAALNADPANPALDPIRDAIDEACAQMGKAWMYGDGPTRG
jgi:hypothetical protein